MGRHPGQHDRRSGNQRDAADQQRPSPSLHHGRRDERVYAQRREGEMENPDNRRHTNVAGPWRDRNGHRHRHGRTRVNRDDRRHADEPRDMDGNQRVHCTVGNNPLTEHDLLLHHRRNGRTARGDEFRRRRQRSAQRLERQQLTTTANGSHQRTWRYVEYLFPITQNFRRRRGRGRDVRLQRRVDGAPSVDGNPNRRAVGNGNSRLRTRHTRSKVRSAIQRSRGEVPTTPSTRQ